MYIVLVMGVCAKLNIVITFLVIVLPTIWFVLIVAAPQPPSFYALPP